MPRIFTGIEIPEDVALSLSMLRGGLPGGRWIDPGYYHLTLRFIGDVEAPVADEVADALARIDRAEFDLTLDGADVFGGRKPHAIVVRAAQSKALMDLQAEQERIIQRIGLPPEARKYTPHVTIARLRGTSGREVAEYMALRGGFAARPFTVERFVLFSSRDTVGGGPYLVEDAYPLSAGPLRGHLRPEPGEWAVG